MSNLVLCFGAPPSKFVLADTRMLYDLFDALNRRYDNKSLAIELPAMMDNIQMDVIDPDDAKWEFWKSNQIQKVKIFYEHNKVTKSVGAIFVNTRVASPFGDLKDDEYKNVLRSEYAKVRMLRKKTNDIAFWEADFDKMTPEK